MAFWNYSPTVRLLLASSALLFVRAVAEDQKLTKPKFTGAQSCSSTSCHGGGTGRNESLIYERKDRHAVSHGILGKGTSLRIAEALGIVGDPGKDAQCNVCHAPMQGVPLERLTKDALADKAVNCEACHAPAENWLLFHTRPDVTFEQMVTAGMRDLNDIYGRANTCVACHLNLDEPIRRAGHPDLHFELDGQVFAQPPHYKDERPSLGPRQWLTGQATALRELSWKLTEKREDALVLRWKALFWLLRKTEAGKRDLPESEDFGAMKTASDQLARNASQALWTKEQIVALLKVYVESSSEFSDTQVAKGELQRRAEVLVPAIYRLWRAHRRATGATSAAFEPALGNANLAAREGEDFEPSRFASALEKLQVALSTAAKQ